MKNLIRFAMALVAAHMAAPLWAAAPPGPYFNGFENNTNGWFGFSGSTITRRHSGYSNSGGYGDGINSATGNWHARLTGNPCDRTQYGTPCYGPYTNWGGYSATVIDIHRGRRQSGGHHDRQWYPRRLAGRLHHDCCGQRQPCAGCLYSHLDRRLRVHRRPNERYNRDSMTLLRDVGGTIPGPRHLRRAFVVPFPAMAAREGMTVIVQDPAFYRASKPSLSRSSSSYNRSAGYRSVVAPAKPG